MPRRNRVDPWGDLNAVPARGMFTGNRGCLVDDEGRLVRHHQGRLWICCVTDYRGWRQPLAHPCRWTPIFFLDDAVALAAGHRPCGLCRREAHRSYQEAVRRADGTDRPPGAAELDRRLAMERHRRGRGLERAADRLTWVTRADRLPSGTIIVDRERHPMLLLGTGCLAFTFTGWDRPRPRPEGEVQVLTPPTSVAALANGFVPELHPTALS